MEHICGVISGAKVVITTLPSEPGRLGWILPCEAFKGWPVLLGVHCDNIDDVSLKEALESSPYFEVARALALQWVETATCMCGESCLGQWLYSILDNDGNLLDEV